MPSQFISPRITFERIKKREPIMLFSINCLEKISENDLTVDEKALAGNCDYQLYKCLKSKRYFFNDFYIHDQNSDRPQVNRNRSGIKDFFGPHINVQAIVGENGSGKSSTMELMYMMINNFSYMFERGHNDERPGADSLYYIPGLFARLYFSLGTDVFELESKGLVLELLKNGLSVRRFVISETEESIATEDVEIADLVENFFYTVVTNYSIQSFIPTNYIHDVYYFNERTKKDCLIKAENAQYDIWINSIFHKNDGYVRSIVLNPYRNNGNIDITNELNLSKDRSCALFLWAKQKGTSYFAPYEYSNLKIKLKDNFLKNKIKHYWRLKREDEEQFDNLFPTDDSCLKIMNENLAEKLKDKFRFASDLNFKKLDNDNLRWKAVLYLQLKILTIINRYDMFLDYRECIKLEKNLKSPEIKIGEDIDKLIDALDVPDSHITKKLIRAFSFLKLSKEVVNDAFGQEKPLNGELYFDELSNIYMDEANINARIKKGEAVTIGDASGPFVGCKKDGNRSFTDPSWIDRILPPSIFDYDLILEKSGELVDFADLSSGELQMLETLSVHSYHIENLISVQKEYSGRNGEKKYHPKYKCVNMVFDEVEMCFHPDYQRQFLKRLLDLIISMKQNQADNGGCYLNIMIITHSPFILSDIPFAKVLYMKDGKVYSPFNDGINGADVCVEKETLGQNIGNLLFNSFFLEYYVGDFAKKKINEFLDEFDKNKSMPKDVFERKIQIFGDRLLKRQMMNYYELHKV